MGNSGAGCVKRTGCEKRFRSISNRVSFPPGEIRKISADINLERKLSTVKRTAHGEADAHGNAAP